MSVCMCWHVLLASVYGMCVCVLRAGVCSHDMYVCVSRCVCVYVCYHAFVFVYM